MLYPKSDCLTFSAHLYQIPKATDFITRPHHAWNQLFLSPLQPL